VLSRRAILVFSVLALLTLAGLTVRPAAARVLHVHPNPEDVTIVGLPNGGHYCVVTSACDTMTPSSIPMDVYQPELLLILSGFVFAVIVTRRLAAASPVLLLLSPPPRLAL
jgi:hypothetical protein